MSLKKSALSGVFWTFLQQFSTQIINFGTTVVLARLILPAEFGLLGMIAIFTSISMVIIDNGMGASIIRTQDPDDDDYNTVFVFSVMLGMLVYLILFFCAPFIAAFFKQPVLTNVVRTISISLVIGSFVSAQKTRFSKTLNFKLPMLLNIPALIGSGIVGIVLAYKGLGIWSLVWANITSYALEAIFIWAFSPWRPKFILNKTKLKYHFNFGYKIALSTILHNGFREMYTMIFGKFFSPAHTGYYYRANTLVMLPVYSIGSVLNKVSLPLFAAVNGDDAKLKDVYKRISKIVVFVVSPILLIMCALAHPMFNFLFGQRWNSAVPYFQILCLNGIVYPINMYNLYILGVKGLSALSLKIELVKNIVTIALIFCCIYFGVFAVLWGIVAMSVMEFLVNSYYSGRCIQYSVWAQIKDLIPTLLAAFIAAVLAYLTDIFLAKNIANNFVRLLIGGTIGVMAYGGISLFFRLSALHEILDLIKEKRAAKK
jgi:teichuronic acid exporter